MDLEDFDFWFCRHKQVLPAVEHWFAAMGQEGQIEVIRTWHAAMADLTLDEAKAATDSIVRGDSECRFASDTPKICRLNALSARQTRRKSESDSGAYQPFCAFCRGTGLATVWHPLVVDSVRRKTDGRYRHPFTGRQILVRDGFGVIKSMAGACACKCTQGKRFEERFPPPAAMVPVEQREPEEVQGLTLEEVINLDIQGSPFMVSEWEYA